MMIKIKRGNFNFLFSVSLLPRTSQIRKGNTHLSVFENYDMKMNYCVAESHVRCILFYYYYYYYNTRLHFCCKYYYYCYFYININKCTIYSKKTLNRLDLNG